MALPSKSRTVGNSLVRECKGLSNVGLLQSDGGTVLSEEIEFTKKIYIDDYTIAFFFYFYHLIFLQLIL